MRVGGSHIFELENFKTLIQYSSALRLDACCRLNNGRLVGVLSKKDCLKAALHAAYWRDWGQTVAEYMSRDIETLPADMDIVAAAEAFLASSFRRFPVMDGSRLVGQISRRDILRAILELW